MLVTLRNFIVLPPFAGFMLVLGWALSSVERHEHLQSLQAFD
jgi:hypothetical protein